MEKSMEAERTGKIWRLIAIDFSLFAAFLLTFAYFHHVRPERLQPVEVKTIVSGGFSPAPASTPTPTPASTPLPAMAELGPEETAPAPASLDMLPSPAPPFDLLGGRFAERFSAGETVKTDMEYRSKNVSVTVERINENNVMYYVADIYLRDLTSLRTAVAMEHIDFNRMQVLEMAELNNAILAVSGDYFAFRKSGVLAVRNGKEWIRKEPVTADILTLYSNGVMEVYYASEKPDIDRIYEADPYQIWCFGPTLVKDGRAPVSYNSTVPRKNPRCAIGYYEPGHYCLLLADGRQSGYSEGMTLKEMTDVFLGLGCRLAYNLDGGDTAVMTFLGQWMSHPDGRPRDVSDIVYIAEPLGNTYNTYE